MKDVLYTYEQMIGDLNLMESKYPDKMSVGEAGTSLDGREIMEVILGNQESSNHILIQASIHGREYLNTILAMKQLEDILKNFENGSYRGVSYEKLFDNVCFHILPMTNPDGVTISQSGPDGIRDFFLRKQLEKCYHNDLEHGEGESSREEYWRRWKANARGVDLNRNFDSGWKEYQSVNYPSSDHYKGEKPESEPEVQAILRLAEEYPIVCTISYHSSGEVVYWDYGSSGSVLEADRKLADLVSELTGYPKESSVQSEQDAAGCSDYFVLECGIPSVTIENGSGECPLSMEEFASIWGSNALLWPALAVLGGTDFVRR
ncbi:MAG TPA: peptidase M14 [Candidatus Pelethocola excrementipullorum]|nr:peptidase M14 [Candidatus Pelethocola excrementipullorum]